MYDIINADLFSKVINDYKITSSVRRTAENCHTSMVTAQRILITANLWSSKSSRKVQELLDQGMTADRIAAELNITKDVVYTYMPYSRGNYGENQTVEAQYSRNYRQRMERAVEGMHKETTAFDAATMPCEFTNLRFDQEEMEDLTENAIRNFVLGDTDPEYGDVYALHLSLVGGFISGADEGMDMLPEERAELLNLAKAKSAISRDILVPGTMNLHALHYAIQKLFGWQNSHLHNYSLSKEDFNLVTEGQFGEYADLSGVLFRFPDNDLTDLYWDDDYITGVSVKTWLKRKYSAPFRQYSIGDSYLGNQWAVEGFRERFPDFTDKTTLQEIGNKVVIDQDWNFLAERLTIREVFTTERGDVRNWKTEVEGKIELLKRELKDEELYGTSDERKEAIDELRKWRSSRAQIDQISWIRPNTYKKEIERAYKQPFDSVVEMIETQINGWTAECIDIFRELNIQLTPFFDTLFYLYDYGDNWCVKISLQDIYHKSKDGTFTDHEMRQVTEDLEPLLAQIETDEKAVCMAADGLNVVDDCGGLHGYLNMLRTISGDDKEEADSMKEWARGLGWTGRKSKPENML